MKTPKIMNAIWLCAGFVVCAPGVAQAEWKYREARDKMSGGVTTVATSKSVNFISLPFPYHGKTRADLVVRKSPSFGLDVIVYLDRGQVDCDIDECPARVRYDDEPPVSLGMLPSDDGSRDLVFFHNAEYAVTKLKTAKKILIELNFYSAGRHVFEFKNAAPLKWEDPYKPTE